MVTTCFFFKQFIFLVFFQFICKNFTFTGLTPGNFHLVINNTNIDDAYKELRSFILKEIKKQQKEGIQVNIKSFELEDDD